MTNRTARQQAVLRSSNDLGSAVLQLTLSWPVDDPYALQSRLRRAILAIPGHLVEAYTHPSPEAFRASIRAAINDARELEDLLQTANRLARLSAEDHDRLGEACVDLIKALYAFLREGSPLPADVQESS